MRINIVYHVAFCTKRIGHFDYSIDMAVKSIEEFNSTLAEFKSLFDQMIDSYDVVIQSKVLKFDYAPF